MEGPSLPPHTYRGGDQTLPPRSGHHLRGGRTVLAPRSHRRPRANLRRGPVAGTGGAAAVLRHDSERDHERAGQRRDREGLGATRFRLLGIAPDAFGAAASTPTLVV